MAIESLQVKSSTTTLDTLNKNSSLDQTNINSPQTLLDESGSSKNVLGPKKAEIPPPKDKDAISLSPAAQAFLDKLQGLAANDTRQSDDKLKDAAIEFRGLTQLSKSRNLTDSENTQLSSIKDLFTEKGQDENDIEKLATDALISIAVQAPELLGKLDSGDITGEQVSRLSKINESLNKANGFGIAPTQTPSSADQVKKVKNDFDNLVQVNKDRKISRDDLSNLDKLATELSQLQGYRLNVRDTIGKDGVVV